MDHVESALNDSGFSKSIFSLLPVMVVVTVFLGLLGYHAQVESIAVLSQKFAPIVQINPAWFLVNMFSIYFYFIFGPLVGCFLPELKKLFNIGCISVAVVVFAISAYQEYRLNTALHEGGWVYCKQATKLYAVRSFTVYAQRPEWCPRSKEEMP